MNNAELFQTHKIQTRYNVYIHKYVLSRKYLFYDDTLFYPIEESLFSVVTVYKIPLAFWMILEITLFVL